MKENKYTLRSSMAAKVLGVLLLCVLGALMLYNLIIGLVRLEYIHYSSWQDTPACISALRNDYYDASYTYMDGILSTENYRSITSNIGVTAEEWDDVRKKFVTVTDTIGTDPFTQSYSGTWAYRRDDSYSDSIQVGDEIEELEPGWKACRITVWLREPVTVHDRYWEVMEEYNRCLAYPANALYIAAGLGIVMALILLFEFFAAGHVRGQDGIALTWADRIPYDLAVFLSVCLLGAGFAAMSETAPDFSRITSTERIVPFILLAMFISLVLYYWMMTTAVRIKAGTLISNTIVARILKKIHGAVGDLPWLWRLVLLAAVLFVLVQSAVFISDVPFEAALLFMAGDVILIALLLNTVYSFGVLLKAGERLAAGNLNEPIAEKQMRWMYGDFRRHAEHLNSLGEGMDRAVNDKMRSERMKTELITNVSHDIKTPLTSIINYVDLLQKEHTDEQEKEYLAVLEKQSARLKKLTADIVEASKASSGSIAVNPEKTDVQEILEQALAEYTEKFAVSHNETVVEVKDAPLYVMADGRLLWRVLNNLFSNIVKYAQPDTRVYASAERIPDNKVRISIKNISREQLNVSEEELMERFVRGDASRHTEGSGLGLSIARSLTELQKGTFDISIDGDLFRADIVLPETV
ncbi:MAG: HAMP domain-containing histidine kinase [Solobacterium sp.]|nr:HAMP domain-containing histidine kinase [Solobacterium sp.]